MTDAELRATLETILQQNRQIIAMLSGQWTAFGGFAPPHGQSNTYGEAQLVLSQKGQNRENPR